MLLHALLYGGGPHTVIKPIPKAIESILYQVFCCSEVEPGVNYIMEHQYQFVQSKFVEGRRPLVYNRPIHTFVDDTLKAW
jgi:hypothetical protein